jgi:phosphoserine phosphatase RsbU/P
MADVSGHSVGAALIMVETRSVLRAQMQATRSTGEILGVLNNLLYEDLTRAELFITMFCGKYDGKRGVFSYSNAGHTRPLLLRGGSWQELDADGLILGVESQVSFEEKIVRLEPGDLLFIFTDGILEAERAPGDFFGLPRLCELLRTLQEATPEAIIDAVLTALAAFCSPAPLQDDVSMVVMKVGEAASQAALAKRAAL